ncbi:uncharacterized protein V6R79_006064 [Siganus canaliculatus]
MESRFAHLRQRDTSVSMLRVKMSRRRSQSQKENRDRAVNTRRQLEKLPELEMSSLDASIAMANMSIIHEKTMHTRIAKKEAVEERIKQLERWKERKVLEKEKEKREKERKGVFKTGVYHPKDSLVVVSVPTVPTASTRAKETTASTQAATRVTRSMKQQQVQKPLKMQDTNTATKKAPSVVERSTRSRAAPARAAPAKPAPAPAKSKNKVCAVEPVVRAPSTRSTNRPPVTAAPAVKDKLKDKPAEVRTTRSRALVSAVVPPTGREKDCKETVDETVPPAVPKEPEVQEPEEKPCPCSPTHSSEEENMMVDQTEPDSVAAEAPSSFAPEGFVFQAPAGLSSFKFKPSTIQSDDTIPTPSLPPAAALDIELQEESSKPCPPKSPQQSPPRASPDVAPQNPASPLESKHDVPYFRSEIANETDRLTELCVHWELKVEDESIPEEMRDRMRTAVGQARLLMKERFKQFSGLVDDCELGRGEKITTCTDLQGFWDMVYYQVEDVNKKFDALKEAESRGWVEEHKPPPRQKKVVKKPSTAPAKPTGTKAAAKSRLAAAKAAMKARQQAAEQAAKDAANNDDGVNPEEAEPRPLAEPQSSESVVFDGGFFQVESPAKATVRRSSRLSAAVQPQVSPHSSYLSPRRVTRRSLALAQTPVLAVASPAQPLRTPGQQRLILNQQKSQPGTPSQTSQSRNDTVNVSLPFSPVKEVLPDITQPEGCPSASVSELITPTLPSIAVVEEQDKPVEANNVEPSLSPCKTPLPVIHASESSCLSFTMSPCVTSGQSAISSPAPPDVVKSVEAQESVCHTPGSSVVEEIPGLDFERYLQPSQRCSLSPRETVAMEAMSPIEAFSPMAVDVEMESPRGQSEGVLTQHEAAIPAVSSVLTLQSPQTQAAESALLLFTPDMKDRIRQSVCPSDLMVFTPPL